MKKIIPILHLVIIILAWSSPWWLDWKLIVAGYVIYLLQNLIFKRCILSISQFGNTRESFYSHYLHKAGFQWPTEKINFIVDYIVPPLLIIAALIYQGVIKL
jgi:hypothetical protein